MAGLIGAYLLGLSVWDICKKELPLWLLMGGGIISILYSVMNFGIWYAVTGGILGLILIIISICLPQSIGVGDGMVVMIYGVLFGWKLACVWLLFGFLLVTVFGLLWSAFNKKKNIQLPFVPFLALVHVGISI